MNRSSASTRKVVVCLTADCQKITVDADVLRASHKFVEAYRSRDELKSAEAFEFPVLDLESGVFRKIIEWCKEHKGTC
ncbi:hypothetical protein AAVH_21833 [Aphelenchoides avenae]|nr:hypothetical protein AAVH_21833 [Aphelenchus avenae]